MVGRQLPLMAVFLPFYVMALYGGWRSIRALWPVLLVAGLSFGPAQFVASNYLDYTLTDVLAALGLAGRDVCCFCRSGSPAPDPEFAITHAPLATPTDTPARSALPGRAGCRG